MNKKVLISFLVVLLLVPLAFFVFSRKDTGRQEIHVDKVKDSLALKVGVAQRIDCLPAFYAESEGIFDSLGVDIKLVRYASQLDCDAALERHRIDGAYTDSKRVEYLASTRKTTMTKCFDTGMTWKLVACRKSRVRNVSQLSDKLVAMTRFSATDYLCDVMMDSLKNKEKSFYRIQVNDVDLRLKMLLGNEVDAAWLPEPQASVAQKHGANVLMHSDKIDDKMAGLYFLNAVNSDERKKSQIATFENACTIAKTRIAKLTSAQYSDLINRFYKYNNVGR